MELFGTWQENWNSSLMIFFYMKINDFKYRNFNLINPLLVCWRLYRLFCTFLENDLTSHLRLKVLRLRDVFNRICLIIFYLFSFSQGKLSSHALQTCYNFLPPDTILIKSQKFQVKILPLSLTSNTLFLTAM